MMLSARLLPLPTGTSGDEAWTGGEAQPGALPRAATVLADRAARHNNELFITS